MPTKEEILNKHTKKYMNINLLNASVINNIKESIHVAVEEYAKQEALEFFGWKVNHSWEMDYREGSNHTDDEYWHEYQQTKQIT